MLKTFGTPYLNRGNLEEWLQSFCLNWTRASLLGSISAIFCYILSGKSLVLFTLVLQYTTIIIVSFIILLFAYELFLFLTNRYLSVLRDSFYDWVGGSCGIVAFSLLTLSNPYFIMFLIASFIIPVMRAYKLFKK
jgi:hypothetical protein